MNEKKTAAQVHHHPNGEGEQIALPGFPLSFSQDTTEKQKAQGLISSLLPSGSERAVSLRRLADITGLSTREVRRALQRERLRGIPICSDNLTGYFLAENDAERAAFCRSMRHRARQILQVVRAVERVGGETSG